MAAKRKPEGTPVRVTYEASKVTKLASKKGRSVMQFTLTMTLSDGCSISVRNCILGIGKTGPWCTAPLIKYRPIIFSKALSDKLIAEFQKLGYLDDLGSPTWAEETDVTIKWEE